MGAFTPKRDESVGRMQFLLGLRQRGIRDTNVLRALETVPRELFVDPADRDVAWEDRALPIACGQTISQPSLVATMTEALDVHPDHTVLEIGTGSGYQAAILGKLARRVVTLERFRTLAELAEARLKRLGLANVEVHVADGSLGWPEAAPVRPNHHHRGGGGDSPGGVRPARGGRHHDRADRAGGRNPGAAAHHPHRNRPRRARAAAGAVRAAAAGRRPLAVRRRGPVGFGPRRSPSISLKRPFTAMESTRRVMVACE